MKKTKHVDLSITLAGIDLPNPIILASGILGLDCDSLYRVAAGGAGAVTLKSLTREARKGHNNPVLIEFEDGFMNAVGYANAGIAAGVHEFTKWDKRVPLVGSIVGTDAEDFAYLAKQIVRTPIAAVEIVLSCPHTPGFGLLAGQGTPEATEKITKAVRKITKLPLFVKLSPSVEAIGNVAKAAEAAGADAINIGNTVGPGMKIDINRAQPILDFRFGGMSGPAIKPIMVRSVWDISEAVKIPVIATGGIMTGEDVVEALMAGASCVEIGTGIYYRGIDIFKKVAAELESWMGSHGYSRLSQFRAVTHEKRV